MSVKSLKFNYTLKATADGTFYHIRDDDVGEDEKEEIMSNNLFNFSLNFSDFLKNLSISRKGNVNEEQDNYQPCKNPTLRRM